ncbi:dUTP diphosphatase [Candidatus Woesearchaeota archaeon]|nr:dUTP diphosphatase [Candidatus Woesearchaeota archaeon]
MVIEIKKLTATAIIPKYVHANDAGMDFYADEDCLIKIGERKLISTGIAMAIPSGYAGLIWDKSGIASKFGLKTMAGVIDASYRGEIKIVVHNLSNQDYQVEKGTKIAQMLIQKVVQKELVEVAQLDSTSRGQDGFGSTGLK